MIDKYYNGVIEQVYNRVGKTERNIVMASYSNDFSIENLETIKRYQANDDSVFLLGTSLDTVNWLGHMNLFWIQFAICFGNTRRGILIHFLRSVVYTSCRERCFEAIMRVESVKGKKGFCSTK